MEKQGISRKKRLHVRLTDSEFTKINLGFKKSTKRKLSEYARAILLNKPITVYTRNQSFDDFVAEMILLRNALNAIGNNFNQAVRKLHMMEELKDVKAWAILNENGKQILFKKIEDVNSKIGQLADKWSHE